MNINQLKYIVTIANEQNISKAAEKLYISQPSLSQCIHNIEKELGTKLFDRTKTPLKITYAGEVYIEWAKKVLNSYNEINTKIADISGQTNIRLIIGISSYRSTCILPPVIKEFKKIYSKCHIIIEEHPTPILHNMLDEDKIDLLIDTPHPDTTIYKSIPLINENILLEVPEDWHFKGKEINLSDCADKPFIMLSKEQLLGQISRELCLKNNFEPNIALECHNIETAHAFVSQGLGAAFVPELFVKYRNQKTNFYKIKGFKIDRKFCVIYNKKKYLPKASEDFINILNQFLHIT